MTRPARIFVPLTLVGLGAATLFAACGRHMYGGLRPAAYVAPLPALEPPTGPGFNTESYDRIDENPFLAARDNPVSTFSIDVDTASYANVRRFLTEGELPPPDAVRLEELVNYFRYSDPAPTDEAPIAARTEVGPCPWAPAHRLLRIGLRARDLPPHRPPPPRNLVYLVDVSGSMDEPNKLPLVKRALALLAEGLTERDRVSLAVYAGRAGLVLPPTPGHARGRILAALDRLEAGGSTNGGQGIELAYATAERAFIEHGVNRVILATDGDFNVGVSSPGALERLIEEKREHGVFLTVLGFGMGNLKDSTMEKLADRGNGNYAYIDTFEEARKVLVEDAAGTLFTVAKDVKVQLELNPAEVRGYRLIGYENRLLRREQFADDRADAGEMGAGQTVTALYEIEPARGEAGAAAPLRYLAEAPLAAAARTGELGTLALRYKEPEGRASRLLSWPIRDRGETLAESSRDFRFAAGVTAFGLSLRGSPHRGTASFAMARELAAAAGDDPHKRELVELCDKARALARKND
jgi:Ca-activated chloride channel family protein